MSSDDNKRVSDRELIAIIGLGGCFPDAEDVPTFWQNICQGHVAIRDVPTERWDPDLYYSEDRKAPDRTYSKIGAFVSEVPFDRKRFRMPPRTAVHIDDTQKMALTAVAEALHDAGLEAFPGSGQGRSFERERTAVILGNSMGGQSEDLTNLRVWFPQVKKTLLESDAMASLSPALRDTILEELETRYKAGLPTVTEDSMPGELSNCIAGRVANAFNLRGPNYTTDAACAASMAAMKTAIDGLTLGDYDMAIVGGSDQQMDPPTFVKFSKIGALSAQHSAPFDSRADGFVMGEGAGVLILKRLVDAERDGDRVYAVVRGVGSASDGKGKGITAPNPIGQKLAVERAYAISGVEMNSVGLFEAHGTSTKVGDRVELEVLTELLRASSDQPKQVPIGSVKSMIGHLKSAAGAASLIKSTLSLYHEKLPPSANFVSAASDSPLSEGYLEVNTTLKDWPAADKPRRAGVSAFGFGGTNFHVVLEEYQGAGERQAMLTPKGTTVMTSSNSGGIAVAPTAADRGQLLAELTALFAEQTGYEADELEPDFQLEADLGIDTVKQAEIFAVIRERYQLPQSDDFKLADVQTLNRIADYVRGNQALVAENVKPEVPTASNEPAPSEGPTVIVFGAETREALLAKADAVCTAARIFPTDFEQARAEATQFPCRLAFVAASIEEAGKKIGDAAKRSNRILAARGIYLTEANEGGAGKTAFLFPGQGSQYIGMLRDLAELYPVVADTFAEGNDILRPLIGGKTLTDIVWPEGVGTKDKEATAALQQTEICQPAMLTADIALMRLLMQFGVQPDYVVGHSLGEYAACVAAGVMTFADALYAVSARGREMASVKVEDCGKMASVPLEAAAVEKVLADVDGYVIAANKNCRKQTVIAGSSEGVEAAVKRFGEDGVDARLIPVSHAFHCEIVAPAAKPLAKVLAGLDLRAPRIPILSNVHAGPYPLAKDEIVALLAKQLESPVEFIAQLEALYDAGVRNYVEVGPRRAITGFVHNVFEGRPYVGVFTNHHKKAGQLGFLEALSAMAAGGVAIDFTGTTEARTADETTSGLPTETPSMRKVNREQVADGSLVVSGVSVALPMERPVGAEGEDVFSHILRGENFITDIGDEHRQAILDKNVVRLEKSTGEFNRMTELGQVIQLAGQLGDLNLVEEFGLDPNFNDALDTTSRLAIAVGIEALKDAGVPLVRRYRTTSTGKKLADGWALPTEVGNRTGVIFASAFPGLNRIIEDVSQHVASKYAAQSEESLRGLVDSLAAAMSHDEATKIRAHFEEHLGSLREEAELYAFNRKFLFRALAMGHAQLAQVIGARGPNTQVNAACASGAQAIAIGSDWIEQGRCDRVIVVTADDVTHPSSLPWIGTGFLAAGAATTEKDPAKAALPFGAKRDGMIVGSGAACFILERDEMVTERGMEPLADILASVFTNTAFHATRLESGFIQESFEKFVAEVAHKRGVSVEDLGRDAFFMSHETYTPARGGSSAAEVNALRHAFQGAASEVLIANTKGFTGHPMGASLEDAVAIKGLQRQALPPVANLNEVDPDFSDLNFSRGGPMDRSVAIRFAAGFGSQVAMVAYGRRSTQEARLVDPAAFQAWIEREAGCQAATYEVTHRSFRVAEAQGSQLSELGIASLQFVEPKEAANGLDDVETLQAVAPVVQLSREDLTQQVTALFAEQTGYEVDELDPTYLLEADLGIDTVKQAEIFGILRETYGMDRDESFNLSDVQTLTAVVDYVQSQLSAAAEASSSLENQSDTHTNQNTSVQASAQTVVSPIKDESTLLTELTALFAEQTGYESDELEPDYQLEADLGIDTVKQAEIFAIIRERYGIGQDDDFELASVQTLRAVVAYVAASMSGDGALSVEPPEPVAEVTEGGSVPTGDEVTSFASGQSAPVAPVGDLLKELTELFAEQTGYETDELEPEYQLEADLGIDTVKQAEIFGIIRERYSIGQDEGFSLSDVQTLHAVVAYVQAQIAAGEQSVEAPSQMVHASSDSIKGPGRDVILEELTSLFAAETGYELDELEPTYQLEADLGIDTVKQAEIFAILRKRYDLPQDESFKLADYQTLYAITDYIISMLGDDHEPTPPTKMKSEREDKPQVVDLGSFRTQSVGVVHSPKRVPSTRSVEGRRWLVVSRNELMGEAMRLELQTRGASAVEVTASVAAGLNHFERSERFDGLAWLGFGTQNPRADLADVFELIRNFAAARRGDFEQVGLLLAAPSEGVFGHFATSRDQGLTAGLAGIAKSMTKEWPMGRALAVDMDPSEREPRKIVRHLADELMSEGPSEVALYRGERLTLQRLGDVTLGDELVHTEGTVLATGGARGVTYELVKELALVKPRKVLILARTLGVTESDSPIFGLSAEEQKAAARSALDGKVERITPVAIKRWIEREEKKLEVTRNLELLRALGCEVEAFQCDVSDHASLMAVAEQVESAHGSVELLIHGAGIEESKFIQDKDADAFERTFKPKADALSVLVTKLSPARTLTMGSVAGRFGNGGQADYSAANEWMGGMARATDSAMVNVCWTAWADVGMATRGSVGKVLSESGVELLPAALGAKVGAYLAMSRVTGDVVVAGALGSFAGTEQPAPRPYDQSDTKAKIPALFHSLESLGDSEKYTRHFDPTVDVGLRDHSIDGVPLLPGVLGVELMTQAASHFAQSPATGLMEVEFSSPIKFFDSRSMDVSVEVCQLGADSVSTEVVTYFKRPNGKMMRRVHFKSTVLTGLPESVPDRPGRLEMPRDPGLSSTSIYSRYFHGPAFQVLADVSRLGEDGVELEMDLDRAQWLRDYQLDGFVTEPHMREVGFQAAGIWEMAELSRMGLPAAIDHVYLSSNPIPRDARVSVRRCSTGGDGASFDIWIHDGFGTTFEVMRGYKTATLRPLRREERFEPVTSQAEVPDWVTVKLTDVEAMLDSEADRTLQKYLSEEEKRTFKGLKTAKRRRDWLSGRIAAKRLIREEHFGRDGAIVPYGAISIVPDPLGAPTVVVVGEGILPIRISISHSDGIAAALLSTDSKVRPGIDVEVIESRHASWAESYFTDEERTWARAQEREDASLTALWAIKEAYLKALGIGARVDFREMNVSRNEETWLVEASGEVKSRLREIGGHGTTIRVDMTSTRAVARVFLATDLPNQQSNATDSDSPRGRSPH